MRVERSKKPDCFGYYGKGSEKNHDDTCEKCPLGGKCHASLIIGGDA